MFKLRMTLVNLTTTTSIMGGIKKHKKHKSEKRDKYEGQYSADKPPALKLILKVGSSSTPEHSNEWPGPSQTQTGPPLYSVQGQDEESVQSAASGYFMGPPNTHHKKSKKKKKKKDKDRERKHRHHHKEKKRKREESSQEDEVSLGEDSLSLIEAIGSPREPRLCVLKQRQEHTSLMKLLEHLLKALEKRDPQQFFAWPVTDNIAPGYSHIISNPMDFSTMKQKIDDGLYDSLQDFIADFRLMCTNAMEYNHIDTVYYKASKKLLHAGVKLMQPDKLGWLLNHLPDLTSTELGFEIPHDVKPCLEMETEDLLETDTVTLPPLSKFEAIPDDLSPDEILAQCQAAAKDAKAKLSLRRLEPKMGFLRQKKDGSTSLNILIGGDGVIPGTNERPVSLGVLTGKLTEGTGQLQGFREDRRNVIKPVKPLYYGAFGSYAPSFDSTFANLTKEESDLVYKTYGSDTAVQYAESILDFAKDCDYTLRLVDSLLDLLTGGDHSKTKKVLEEKKKLKEEEETIRSLLEDQPSDLADKMDLDQLKSLSDIGIDISFLNSFEASLRKDEEQLQLQQRLQTTSQLLEKLQQVQNERLSLPLPSHLANIPGVTDQEMALAESITSNLTDMAKKVNPSDIASVTGLRKAMGITSPEDDVDVVTLATDSQLNVNPTSETGNAEMPDLESELRQFLESEPALSQSPLRDDKTIEEILME